jgi:hypothetical protein
VEQLLVVLFVLFSIFSALSERRKRKRQLEESRRRAEGQPQAEPAEEPQVGSWPFPPGGGPFDLPVPVPRRMQQAVPEEEEFVEVPAAQAEAQAAEERVRDAERRIREYEEQARELRLGHQPVVEERAGRRPSGARNRWALTPKNARQAMVYAEILGPPKAERREEW